MSKKALTAPYTVGNAVICRLPHGADLLEAVTEICIDENIQMAALSGIGALDGVRIAYYDQDKREYNEIEFKGHFEILNLVGNVSLRDGKPMCHAHIICGDEKGATFGGHLVKGCTIFACELALFPLQGEPLVRGFDEETGLPLWGGSL